MIMMLVLVLGTSWALVNAISGAARNTVNEQTQTGDSLVLAKYALLGYLAQQALTSDVPGMFPCPESTSSIGTANEGTANSSCSTLPAIGRLPWKTLGIDKPLDGAGEALWYAVGTGVRAAPINFSTTGALTVNAAPKAAVAVIIAPGAALNNASSTSSAPAPCVKRDQAAGRSGTPLNASDFVECGNATMADFVSSRNDSWGNDRVVTITATEMLKAIEGAVADRIQRNVTPALNGTAASTGWYQKNSYDEWGAYFFPYASSWSHPTSNDSCGTYGVTEGLLPLASGDVASGPGCSARWTSATVAKVSGNASNTLDSYTCTPGTAQMTCVVNYTRRPGIQVIATAPNIAMGFRTRPAVGDITFTPLSSNSVSTGPSGAIVTANGNGTITFRMSLVNRASGGTITIFIPNPADSFLINTSTGSNPDLAWFINNQWQRYTYYAISPAVTANPSGTCTSGNVTDCLTLTNAEAGTGNVNDKRVALVLSGRPLTGKTQPSSSMSDYFEAQNTSTGDRNFQRDTISTTFNDRPSVCPFQRQTTGSANVLCN